MGFLVLVFRVSGLLTPDADPQTDRIEELHSEHERQEL